jgi:monoterpene epsilon-lactone hydrolase
MASKQSEANKRHYEASVAQSSKQLSPEEAIDWNDEHWTALTAEPRGVDYVEVDADGTRAMWLIPKGCVEDRVIFCVHGGGYVGGSIYTHRKMHGHLAKATGCRALSVDYDYAHQSKYPAQRNQVLTAYRWLLGQGITPNHIAAVADSVGVAALLGALLRARDEQLPLPAALMTISGWFDMTQSGASYQSNREKDAFFLKETVDWLAHYLLGGADPRDPYASPLYSEIAGLPPIFLQAGADEALLDDSKSFAERAKNAGVEVRFDAFPEMLHSCQMMAGRAPEADDAINRFAQWVQPKLGLESTGRKAA